MRLKLTIIKSTIFSMDVLISARWKARPTPSSTNGAVDFCKELAWPATPGSHCWMKSPVFCGLSNSLPHQRVGRNWMRRRTKRRCMWSGPARLNRRSTLYTHTGYLIEKGKLRLRAIPREPQESQRWGAMRLAPVEVERNTNIAVVPDGHCIDPIVGNV